MGKLKCIRNPNSNKLMSPMGVLNVHFQLMEGRGPATEHQSISEFFAIREELALDPHGRVATLRVSNALYEVTAHFSVWVKESFNPSSDQVYMGPPGRCRFDERNEAESNAVQENEGTHQEDYGDYSWIREMDYNDLREKCKNAGLMKNLA